MRPLQRVYAVIVCLTAGWAMLSAQPDRLDGLFVAGAEDGINDTYSIRGTAGQAMVGAISNATFTVGAGLWYWTRDRVVIGLEDEAGRGDGIPTDYLLEANYPNPFNPSTTIPYGLPEPGAVRIEVFDVLGRLVQVLADREQPAGYHTVQWDARTASGAAAPSGLYLVRLTAASASRVRTIMLLR